MHPLHYQTSTRMMMIKMKIIMMKSHSSVKWLTRLANFSWKFIVSSWQANPKSTRNDTMVNSIRIVWFTVNFAAISQFKPRGLLRNERTRELPKKNREHLSVLIWSTLMVIVLVCIIICKCAIQTTNGQLEMKRGRIMFKIISRQLSHNPSLIPRDGGKCHMMGSVKLHES